MAVPLVPNNPSVSIRDQRANLSWPAVAGATSYNTRYAVRPKINVTCNTELDLDLGSVSGGARLIDIRAGTKNSSTIWIVNNSDNNAMGFDADTLQRNTAKDIDLGSFYVNSASANEETVWFWSHDVPTGRAYNAVTLQRDASKDISGPNRVVASAIVGDTLWTVANGVQEAHARTVSTKERDLAKDIDIGINVNACFTDGRTIWFAHSQPNELRAFDTVTLKRDRTQELTLPNNFTSLFALYSNGAIYVGAERSINAVNHVVAAAYEVEEQDINWIIGPQSLPNNAANIDGLQNGVTYMFQVSAVNTDGASNWSEYTLATQRAAPTIDSILPSVEYIDVHWDRVNSATAYGARYRSAAQRDLTDSEYRSSGELDISLAMEAEFIVRLGDTLWVGNGIEAEAYSVSTRDRVPSKDITLPTGKTYKSAVTDGTTLWFTIPRDTTTGPTIMPAKGLAYDGTTLQRVEARDLTLSAVSRDHSIEQFGEAIAATSDGTTLWFLLRGSTPTSGTDVVAFNAATGARDSSKDLHSGLGDITGIATDGSIVWFYSREVNPGKAYAYNLEDLINAGFDANLLAQARIESRDITQQAGNPIGSIVYAGNDIVYLEDRFSGGFHLVAYEYHTFPLWILTNEVTDTTIRIPGLVSDTEYDVQLRSNYNGIYSEWSDTTSTRTLVDLPPTFGDQDIPDQYITLGDSFTIDYPAATGGNPPLEYFIIRGAITGNLSFVGNRASLVGSVRRAVFSAEPGSVTYQTEETHFTRVIPYNQFSYIVRDTNGDTDSIPFRLYFISRTIDGPTGFIGVPGNGSVILTWDDPSRVYDRHISFQFYHLQYREGSSGDWINVSTDLSVRTATVTNLVNGTQYQFRVRAYSRRYSTFWSTTTATPAISGAPVFRETIDNQLYVQNRAIPTLNLPVPVGGTAPLTYSVSSLPDGLIFSDTARTITGIPTTIGSRVIVYTVTDGNGVVATLSFTIDVVAADQVVSTPRFTVGTIQDRSYIEGSRIFLSLPHAVGGVRPLQYTITQLPNGLSFNDIELTIFGTPTEVGTTSVTYTVTDTNGANDVRTFLITILEDEASIPTFGDATIANQIYPLGVTIDTLTLPTASGGRGTLTYSLTGSRPTGITYDPNRRQLTGTPVSPGTFTAIYTARDSNNRTASLTFTIFVSVVNTFGLHVNPLTTTAEVVWDAFGTGATYDLRYRNVAEVDYTIVNNITSNSYTITGLLPATTYSVEVHTKLAGQIGPWVVVEFTTRQVVPDTTDRIGFVVRAANSSNWNDSPDELQFTEITDSVIGFELEVGRLTSFGRHPRTKATITLDNTDKRFTGGGTLTQRTIMQISAYFGGELYDLAYGSVRRVRTIYRDGGNILEVSITDVLLKVGSSTYQPIFHRNPLNIPVINSGHYINDLASISGYSASYRRIPQVGPRVINLVTDATTLLRDMQLAANSDGGLVYSDSSGFLVFTPRQTLLSAMEGNPLFTIGPSHIKVSELSTELDDTDIINSVTINSFSKSAIATRSDPNSQREFSTKALKVNTVLNSSGSGAEAASLAEHILRLKKDIKHKVSGATIDMDSLSDDEIRSVLRLTPVSVVGAVLPSENLNLKLFVSEYSIRYQNDDSVGSQWTCTLSLFGG